ncbi:IclR family transcriptional regulator [Pseudomonas fluorescens]|uniref:HTH-type transcriptional regulator SrpS n=1 Tax=Pseudomonas fluorescens TaxID=294 RepID=A0A5E7EMB6_PSEFL|nr:IclR family transcriptional regulator [Pseudomonas fluorescens]VVO27940.1 HTH-type transcriptional regulator SrpS [Pseudomonas fluorescens]
MSRQEDTTQVGKQPGIQVIARAAAIMRALGENPQGLSLAAIANAVDLPRSTVQRIISALEDEFLVESVGRGGGFHLGPALGQLIHQTQTDIISLLKTHLTALCEQLQESVCVSLLVGDKTYVVDRIVAERELRVVFPIGINAPAYATASGKVLLAEMPEEALESLLPASLQDMTSATLERSNLLTQLATIRRTKIGHDKGEYIEGLSSFAVALNTYLGRYAIAVVAPVSRAQAHAERFEQALMTCKQNIEQAIGARLKV